jgi:glycerate 2-kinase
MSLLKPLDHLEQIFRAGLSRVDSRRLVENYLRLDGSTLVAAANDPPLRIDLDAWERLLVIGAGKATAAMAQGLEEILGERISEGLIVVKYGHTMPLRKIETLEAGHPLPDANSARGARRLMELAQKADARTLVINLISGGGSALLAAPLQTAAAPLNLEDKQATTRLLLGCGATIDELNCIRKHLSAIKGGRLARLLHPAHCLNLVLSDVVGDRLDVIASGLTAPDPTTFADALDVLDRYLLREQVPRSVRELLEKGAAGEVEETPKPGNPVFARIDSLLLGSNLQALQAAAVRARDLGYHTAALTCRATGEARNFARLLLALAVDVRDHQLLAPRPACLLAGGETTVTLRGPGKGGRNQELALAFLTGMTDDTSTGAGLYLLSAATDGNDGPTDAAGAFASNELLVAARQKGLDPAAFLNRNDAYPFFDRLGALLRTGPTKTNVCDLQVILIP